MGGLVDLASLRSDPLWEQDFITSNWVWHPPEYFAARAEVEEGLPAQREAAEIALHLALIGLEGKLPTQVDGPPFAYIPDVGAYEEIVSWDHHILGDIHSFSGKHATSSEAIAAWKSKLLAKAAQCGGDTLWWRTKPEIDGRIPFGESVAQWRVYSRLLIGNIADTLIERLRRGEMGPTRNMVADNLVTAEQLNEIGWSLDENGDWSKLGWVFDYGKGRPIRP